MATENLNKTLAQDPTTDIVGRLCILNPADRMLLVRRQATAKNNPLLWEFPGGGCLPWEKDAPFNAAIRETLEETGLEPDLVSTEPISRFRKLLLHRPGKSHAITQVSLTYPAHTDSGDLLILSDEVQDAGWFSAEVATGLDLTPFASKTIGSLVMPVNFELEVQS